MCTAMTAAWQAPAMANCSSKACHHSPCNADPFRRPEEIGEETFQASSRHFFGVFQPLSLLCQPPFSCLITAWAQAFLRQKAFVIFLTLEGLELLEDQWLQSPGFPVLRSLCSCTSRSALALWLTADVHQSRWISITSQWVRLRATLPSATSLLLTCNGKQGCWRATKGIFRKIVWKQWRKDHWIFLNALLSPACNGQCGFMEWLPPAVHNILWITIFPKAWI